MVALALVGLQLGHTSLLVRCQADRRLMFLHVVIHALDQVVLLTLELSLAENMLHTIIHLLISSQNISEHRRSATSFLDPEQSSLALEAHFTDL